jgi:WD40 repeat protein
MMAIEYTVPSRKALAHAVLLPAQASRLCLALAATCLALSAATPTAVAGQTPGADRSSSVPSPTSRVGRSSEASGGKGGGEPERRDGGAGWEAGAEEPRAREPSQESYATNHSALLVEQGEPIQDIDKIVEALDRRAPVSAVAFSPDGALIASGSEDHMVRVWHVATGRLTRRLEGHSSAVTAVAFSPDGATLASASNDRTVRLWNVNTGRLMRTLQGHVYYVYAVAFDPQGRWLATASWDQTIQLWDVGSGALVKKFKGHSAAIRSIDFSRDGKTLASGSDDQTIRLWNVDTGREIKVLAGHAGPVRAVRFRPDGEWLFSGSTDQTVRMWRLADGAMVHKLGDCGAPVSSLAISANGRILGGGCGAGGSVLWDIPTNAQIRRLSGHGDETRAIAFSPDGRIVATGSEDGSILVEDVATGRALASLSANVAHLQAVAFSPDGGMLATASRDQRVLLWQDVGDHKALSRVLVGGSVRALAFSPDGKSLAAGGEDREVAVWDLGSDGPVRKLAGHEGVVNAVAFSPKGRTIFSAGDDTTVRVWDLKTGAEAKVMKGHRAPVRALAVSPDGAVLASASDDETVRLWDTATGRNLAVLKGHLGPVTSAAFISDGKYLVTGSQDRTIDVWLAARGKLLKGMRKELPSGVVALAAHGGRIVAASSDGVLGLWELAGSRPLKQSTEHADAVSALAFATDGATIASASRDGVLRVWDGKTLERRWSLAGSTRERWFACNDAQTCWRREDGALLSRVDGQGDIVPVPPSDDAHRTALVVTVDWHKLGHGVELMEGRTAAIPVRIENRGPHPAYWVNVAQSVRRTASSRTSLVLIPPPTLAVLAPSAGANVVCEVSALGEYENPQPHSDTLRLAITSASAETLSLEIPVRVDTPHLKMRRLSLTRGPGEAVVASMTGVSMAQLQPVLLQGGLTLEGDNTTTLAPIVLEQAFNGQDLDLSFPLPGDVRLDRRSRATFTVRKITQPAHVWTFALSPVNIPIPIWFWALLFGGVLGLGFVLRQAGLRARARPLGRVVKRIARLAVVVMLGLVKALMALVFFPSTLRSLRARLQRRGTAVMFFRLQPETQCSHLARQLGASWAPLAGGHQPVFELHFGPDVPLNLERCLLALPAAGDTLGSLLAHLDATDEGRRAPASLADGPLTGGPSREAERGERRGEEGAGASGTETPPGLPNQQQNAIAVVLSDAPRSELAAQLRAPCQFVVFSKPVMNRVLRAPQPALAFAQVVSNQVDRATVSLYRSAVRSGQRQPFYGRKGELRRLAVDPRGNCLIVGPHGIGKTRLLDEIHRRFRAHPTVECHYLSLADGDLTAALSDALGMPGERSLDTLLDRLADRPKGRKVLVLCDDADAWATLDAAAGGVELQALARLNREHRCSFVLAGFLGLLHAARPLPGREPFGDVVRLECLDTESCVELATEPMAALNVHYAAADLVELIARQSGGMPSLLVAICDQLVAQLEPDRRTIDQGMVESACKSEAVTRAITAWRPRFGLQEPRFATLDQTIVLSGVFKARFSLQELQSTLANLGVQATAAEIEHSARRLVAACVFEHWLGHFHFRVPLFQTVMQEATLARMIAQ